MDSITQMALGAAVGEATLGRKLGNRALLIGGLLGTLPDLDVLVPFGSAVADFTYHRSFSHSFIVLTLISPLVAWLGFRVLGQTSWRHWWLAVLLVFNTHVLLDCFTVYGTQALWPLSDYPIAWGTIFIIDPFYTVPLIVGLVLTLRRDHERRFWPNTLGLTLSTAFLAWTVVAHRHAHNNAIDTLEASGFAYHSLLTVPAPFSVLWRSVARGETEYAEGFYSLLDSRHRDEAAPYTIYDSQQPLYTALENHWPVQRLAWFTKGFYTMQNIDGAIVMTDLRMGIEASYVFNFLVGRETGEGLEPVISELRRFEPDIDRVKAMFKRQFDPTVSLHPTR